MLSELEIENYQSLRKLSVRLGRFTVITGPSSSGKSAVVRALRLLAFNARGTSYISQGARFCVVGVGNQDEGWAASIIRGARGKDAYRVAYAIPELSVGFAKPKIREFTKLGGAVPDYVTQLLQLTEVNFARQFDRPYLLTESAGEVARRLGALTNVTWLFAAAREADTRRKRLSRQAADAREEYQRALTEAQRFRNLKHCQQTAQQAAECLDAATATAARIGSLRAALELVEASQQVLDQSPPPLPDFSHAEDLREKCNQLRGLILAHGQAVEYIRNSGETAAAADRERQVYEKQLDAVLTAAGVCPTCGQAIAKQ